MSLLLRFPMSAEPAGEPIDKSGYHLFKPVPRSAMREMATDRPDLTESPFTVDAGHFQLEMDLVNFTYDHRNSDHETVHAWNFAPFNLKAGLLNHTDLQLVFEPFHDIRTRDRLAHTHSRHPGWGDLVVRLKQNFWGNDGGRTAFAAMPFVKVPTNDEHYPNDAWEGGLILPLAVSLPAGWDMGVMSETDLVEDEDGSGYHPDFIQTITFSHDIIGKLAGYMEFASLIPANQGSSWIGSFDFGFTLAVTDNLQLDCGMNIGITRAADDFNPFVGISYRY